MNNTHKMEECLAYIDAHAGEKLTPRQLAEQAGYSFNHFCYIFERYSGVPIAEYLRRKRLARAAKALDSGESITEIAMENGYLTSAGFAKAFKKEFGVNATEYQRRGGGIPLKPRIRRWTAQKAVGYLLPPRDGREWDPCADAAYWLDGEFSANREADYRRLAAAGKGEIGAWLGPDESGNLTYFFGPLVEDFSDLPPGMHTLTLPAATYAVFATVPVDIGRGKAAFRETINRTLQYIYGEWAERTEYTFDQEHLPFEYYRHDSGVTGGEASVEIFVPIRKARQ